MIRLLPSARARRPPAFFVLLVVLCVVGTTCAGKTTAPRDGEDPRYCLHRYAIDEGRVPVCATMPLSRAHLRRLQRQVREVTRVYPSFAARCGLPFERDALTPPTLHVIRYEELNDREAFPRARRVKTIVGRYYVGRGAVFVTERALEDRGAVHLPHELAHWIHDKNGLTDPDEDERLARAFHRFYRQRTRHARGADPVTGDPLLLALTAPEASATLRDRSLGEGAEGREPASPRDDVCAP